MSNQPFTPMISFEHYKILNLHINNEMKLWIWKNTPGNCVPEPPSHDHLQNEKIKDK
jgi:hypothetical protein